ncbi:MAG: hypothetical protein JWN04_5697 [Myxococcaceae bacterium]|nr:hypothetical protein [Myxococcaceae bacterium]
MTWRVRGSWDLPSAGWWRASRDVRHGTRSSWAPVGSHNLWKWAGRKCWTLRGLKTRASSNHRIRLCTPVLRAWHLRINCPIEAFRSLFAHAFVSIFVSLVSVVGNSLEGEAGGRAWRLEASPTIFSRGQRLSQRSGEQGRAPPTACFALSVVDVTLGRCQGGGLARALRRRVNELRVSIGSSPAMIALITLGPTFAHAQLASL